VVGYPPVYIWKAEREHLGNELSDLPRPKIHADDRRVSRHPEPVIASNNT